MKTLIAALVLGGAFGSASATVESMDDGVMVIELRVEVLDSAESVVAHLAFEDEPILTLPLLDRGDGTFGIRTELEPKNFFVVFETVGPEREESEPVSLTQLGAELLPESGITTTTVADEALSEDSQQMLWLAIALGAGSLSLLAFWVLGGRDGDVLDDAPDTERMADEEE
ncbi:MAG TPA: hypothetical protein VMM14_00520 [Acidimicrobiia bacterium]|nr:hypothetical protein [Acidimicrobiia bacterium]